MRNASAALALLVSLAPAATVGAQGTVLLGITCEVRDYGSEETLEVEGVSVSVDEFTLTAARTGSQYLVRETLSVSPPDALTVRVEANDSYAPRQVQLRRLPNERDAIRRRLDLFLVEKTEGLAPFSEVLRAKQMLDQGRIERAVALLEREYELLGAGVASEQKLAIRYNYARAALDACTELGYATCELARQRCRRLSEELAQDPGQARFLRGVSTDEIATCATAAESKLAGEAKERLRLTVERATEKIARGGPGALEGARELQALLAELEGGAVASLPRSVASLERDIGVGLMRYESHLRGNGAAPDERRSYLEEAVGRFQSAIARGDQSSVTATDLGNAKDRLEGLEQQLAGGAPVGG